MVLLQFRWLTTMLTCPELQEWMYESKVLNKISPLEEDFENMVSEDITFRKC